jgi:hypothetical protein
VRSLGPALLGPLAPVPSCKRGRQAYNLRSACSSKVLQGISSKGISSKGEAKGSEAPKESESKVGEAKGVKGTRSGGSLNVPLGQVLPLGQSPFEGVFGTHSLDLSCHLSQMHQFSLASYHNV